MTRSPSRSSASATRARTGSRPRRAGPAPASPDDVVAQLRRIERDGGDGILVLAEGATLAVSSLDRPYFPDDGITKGGLMRYYARVAPTLLPLLHGRPLALRRYPAGITGDAFFQHDPGDHVPDVVRTHPVRVEHGPEERRLVGGDPALATGQALGTLLYTVQLGTITVNPWHSRVGTLDEPDYAVLDLDPGPAAPFPRTVEVARLVRDELARRGLVGVAKTSGSRGIHLLVPLPPDTSYDASARLAEEVASAVADRRPDVATVERSLARRAPDAVYVDHLQNAYGKTLASALAVRPRPGAPVSAPLSWRQLTPSLDPGRWTVATVPRQRRALEARWTAGMAAPNLRARTDYGGRAR